jgi:two-component system response regulator FixJ
MLPIHLFTTSPATAAAVTALLPAAAEVRLHAPAAPLPADLEQAGGCVLFDMDEPQGCWRALLGAAGARSALPVVLLTAAPVTRDIVVAVRLGAADVIDWRTDGPRLHGVVLEVAGGRRRGAAADTARPLHGLTPRQRQILALASHGLQSKGIARSLRISKRTVDAHRARMVKRLQASSFLELVREQIRHEVGAGA